MSIQNKNIPFGNPLIKGLGQTYKINHVNGCGYSFQGITGGNSIIKGQGAMPAKFYPSVGSSMFARARTVYSNDAGGGQSWFDSSQHTYLKKINAIGRASQGTKLVGNQVIQIPLSFASQDVNVSRSARRRTRSGGAVAPPKKGLFGRPNSSAVTSGGTQKRQNMPGCC